MDGSVDLFGILCKTGNISLSEVKSVYHTEAYMTKFAKYMIILLIIFALAFGFCWGLIVGYNL